MQNACFFITPQKKIKKKNRLQAFWNKTQNNIQKVKKEKQMQIKTVTGQHKTSHIFDKVSQAHGEKRKEKWKRSTSAWLLVLECWEVNEHSRTSSRNGIRRKWERWCGGGGKGGGGGHLLHSTAVGTDLDPPFANTLKVSCQNKASLKPWPVFSPSHFTFL